MPSFEQLPCPALVTDSTGNVLSLNHELLLLIGGDKERWITKPMELMLPIASRIFLQTHVLPMLLRDGKVREIRLQLLVDSGNKVPVFVNCQKTTHEGIDRFTWVLFVTIERSRFEQEILESKQRSEAISASLTKSENFLRTVTDALPSMVGYWDSQLICRFANKPYLEWFGRSAEEMVGLSMISVLGDRLFAKNLSFINNALAGNYQQFERAIHKPDGSIGYTMADYIPDKDMTGSVKGFFELVTNITHLREADAAIRLSASVFEAAAEGIMVTDKNANIVSVNPAFSTLSGYCSEEVIGQNARILNSGRHDKAFFGAMFQQLKTDKFWKGEVWSKRKDGTIFLEQLSISSICNEEGNVLQYVGVSSDVTERWDKEQLVRHMASHDGLTGLPNRLLLMERLDQLIRLFHPESRHIALMFLDLDGFKKVNDTLGHSVGDEVLKTVSTRLSGLLHPSDTVARLGGDEFVILLDNPQSNESVAQIGTRIIAVLNEPMVFGEVEAHVGTSIGIAVFKDETDSAEALLKRADDAMYVAKAAGKNVYRWAAS
jgi:diguanylate cyclase (GGDEF)-like protein/PAS domain S-box-containing protein